MKRKIDIIIAKYLLGIAGKEENSQLVEWLKKNEANKKYFGEVESIWNATEIVKNRDVINPDEAWEKIESKISPRFIKVQASHEGKEPEIPAAIRTILRIAAIIVFTFGLSWGGFYIYYKKVFSASAAYNEVVVPRGSKSIINLPDGTKIWLNAETTLKYPEKFTGKNREVSLYGEAFFDVAKDEKKPFTVKTSDLDITALGTTFNVKSYSDEGTIETILVTGSLCVKKEDVTGKTQRMILKPKQRLTFVKKKGKILVDYVDTEEDKYEELSKTKDETIVKRIEKRQEKIYLAEDVDTEMYTSWKDHKLIFKNETFESLAEKLGRWYNVKISIEGEKLKKYSVTGTFENETIEQALKALQLTTPFVCHFEQNNITIKYN